MARHQKVEKGNRLSGQIYIAWTRFQRRLDSMAARTELKAFYIPPKFEPKWLKPVGYVLQAAETFSVIVRHRPSVVWYQLPPTFLSYIIVLARLVSGKPFKIVADCHNATFRPPWSTLPGYKKALRSADVILVHNSEIADRIRQQKPGMDIHVLEDPPAIVRAAAARAIAGRPFVLIPCSFHDDEPVDALLEAARRTPQFDFVVTGSRQKAQQRGYLDGAPGNVRFAGYVPTSEFNTLLQQCAVLMGLTTFEGVQLSVANEGIGVGKAMVLSNTRILRDMFSQAAVMAENDPASLSHAVQEAFDHRVELEHSAGLLRARIEQEWRASMGTVMRKLAQPGVATA